MSRKKTKEEFIEQAQIIHNNKYNYSLVDYINSKVKVKIICPEHGIFEQTPNNHLKGQNCPKCKGNYKSNTEEFIGKAKKVHKDYYNYSNVNYVNNKTLVEIICPKHGSFWQKPNDHLDGHGCSKCGNENNSYSKEEWIDRVTRFHNNKYNYSKVNYIDWETPVIIICPIHGEFQQTPHSHTRYGCSLCNSSHNETLISKYLNQNNIIFISQYKISIDKSINPSGYAYIDFYLPEYNMFIEYNGEQHYIPVEHFGGEIKLKQQQERDNFIREYCIKNNIKLIEISYKDNVQECLNNNLIDYHG